MSFLRLLAPFALVCAVAGPLAAEQAPLPQITVTGEGTVSLAPDIALVRFGVVAQNRSAAAAVADMSDAMQATFNALAAAGIAPADMQTSGLHLGQRYDSSSSPSGTPAGFEAATTVTLTVRDLDRLGAVLDAALGSGVNQISGLNFDVADKAPHAMAARAAAVRDARARAEVLADAAGLTLGPISTITENGGGSMMMADAPMVRLEAAGVPVAAGELTVSAHVTVVFELLPR